MHDHLFANQRSLGSEDLIKQAQAVGLDPVKFKVCLDGDKYAPEIKNDLSEGQKAGITGTPSFLLGYSESNGSKMKAVKMLSGAQPFLSFKEALDNLLSQGK